MTNRTPTAVTSNKKVTSKTMISSAMEDYLKAIYELGEKGIKTQTLADALEVSPASVTGMLKKLASLKLVKHEKYYGVSLTKAGRLMALETLRHHRLIETYLAEALGYKWHEVHEEAEKLEHHISEAFEERIAAVLGHPTHDPHGDPIPQLDGSVPESSGYPLDQFQAGDRVRISRITNQESDVLRYLEGHYLMPRHVFTILTKDISKEQLILDYKGDSFALSLTLARGIHAVKI